MYQNKTSQPKRPLFSRLCITAAILTSAVSVGGLNMPAFAGVDNRPPAGASDVLRQIVPAYFYPEVAGSAQNSDPKIEGRWLRMCSSPLMRDGIIIVNPGSGPGQTQDWKYRAVLDKCREYGVGIRMIGYITTLLPSDPGNHEYPPGTTLEDIQQPCRQVDRWLRLYPGRLDGIFVDEMSTDSKQESRYQTLKSCIAEKPTGGAGFKVVSAERIVVGNPGTSSEDSKWNLAVADVVVVKETTAEAYLRWSDQAEWTLKQENRSRMAHMVHTATNLPPQGECEASKDAHICLEAEAAKRKASYVYVTDVTGVQPGASSGPNPWLELPSWWQQRPGRSTR